MVLLLQVDVSVSGLSIYGRAKKLKSYRDWRMGNWDREFLAGNLAKSFFDSVSG